MCLKINRRIIMKSFQSYIKEQEELAIVKVEEDKKQKLADFIRKIDDLNDEKFHAFAVDELGMSEDEAETLAYKMLKAVLLKAEAEPEIVPDELDIDVSDGSSIDALTGDDEGMDIDMGDELEMGSDEEEDEDW
jgi:hypothetical protein